MKQPEEQITHMCQAPWDSGMKNSLQLEGKHYNLKFPDSFWKKRNTNLSFPGQMPN